MSGETTVARKLILGSRELKLLLTLEKEGTSFFRFHDAATILSSSEASVKNVLYRLKKKGRVEEIEKGKYLLIPARAGYGGEWSEVPFLVVPHIVKEYYVGFWSALNYWGLTEHVPRTIFVATPLRKRNLEFGAAKFEFVTLGRKRFFGFKETKAAGGSFKISTPEKTIVDCAAFPKYSGGIDEVAKALWTGRRELKFSKLRNFALRFGSSVVIRRLGYLLHTLNMRREAKALTRDLDFSGFMWLDPLGVKKASAYSKEYGLALNRARDDLLSWRGY